MALTDTIMNALGKGPIKKYKAPFFDNKGYVEFEINTQAKDEKKILQAVRIFNRFSVPPAVRLAHNAGAYYYKTFKYGGDEMKTLKPVTTEGLNVLEFYATLPDVPMTEGWFKTGIGKLYLSKETGELKAAFLRFHTAGPTKTVGTKFVLAPSGSRQFVIAILNMELAEADEKRFTEFKSVSFGGGEGWKPGFFLQKVFFMIFPEEKKEDEEVPPPSAGQTPEDILGLERMTGAAPPEPAYVPPPVYNPVYDSAPDLSITPPTPAQHFTPDLPGAAAEIITMPPEPAQDTVSPPATVIDPTKPRPTPDKYGKPWTDSQKKIWITGRTKELMKTSKMSRTQAHKQAAKECQQAEMEDRGIIKPKPAKPVRTLKPRPTTKPTATARPTTRDKRQRRSNYDSQHDPEYKGGYLAYNGNTGL